MILIKILFRLYGGELYTNYIAIDEADIARALKINLKKVKEQLHLLHEYQVIDYRKINLKPQVEFLKGRLDLASLPIKSLDLKKLNKQNVDKFDYVIRYVKTDYVCRTRMLLDYFGERMDFGCGLCDFCLSKIKSNETVKFF